MRRPIVLCLLLGCQHSAPSTSDAGADATPVAHGSPRDDGGHRLKSSQPGHLHREDNFIDGTGITTTIVDNTTTGQTDITIASTVGGFTCSNLSSCTAGQLPASGLTAGTQLQLMVSSQGGSPVAEWATLGGDIGANNISGGPTYNTVVNKLQNDTLSLRQGGSNTTGQPIVWNGSAWQNMTMSGDVGVSGVSGNNFLTIVTHLNNDTLLTRQGGSNSAGQVLGWNASGSDWQNMNLSALLANSTCNQTIATSGTTALSAACAASYAVFVNSVSLIGTAVIALPNAPGVWAFDVSQVLVGSFALQFSSGSAVCGLFNSNSITTNSQLIHVYANGSNHCVVSN